MKTFVVGLLLFAIPVFAQQQEKTYTLKESELTEQQKSQLQGRQITSDVHSWTGVGHEVGVAMKEGLSALNDEVNKFSESPAGKFTMFIIAYKVLGQDLMRVTIITPIWIAGFIYFMFIFYRNCVTHRMVSTKEGKKKTYGMVHGGEGMGDLGVSRIIHFLGFMVWTGIMLLAAFA